MTDKENFDDVGKYEYAIQEIQKALLQLERGETKELKKTLENLLAHQRNRASNL